MNAICCVGHITLDKITTPALTQYQPGGTAYYFTEGIRRLGPIGYRLITAVGPDERTVVDRLRAAGVEVSLVDSPASVFFENIYGEDQNQRTQRVRSKAAPFTVAAFEDVLVSTGGGTPCFFDNMDYMNACGATIYLKVSVEELARRLEVCKRTRPVLRGRSGEELRDFIAESLELREPYYGKASVVFDAERMLTESDVRGITDALVKIIQI